MKLTSGYMIREIAGNFVIVPISQTMVDYKKMLHTNESGAFIFDSIQKGMSYEELLDAMVIKYQASEDELAILRNDLDEFLEEIVKNNLIDDVQVANF